MSILIRGMEMPKNCQECGLYIEGACYAKGYRDYRSIMDTAKPDDCPLVELPPHGRLIDVDEPMTKISTMMQEPDYQHEGENWMVGLIMARDALDEAPTVIEAEGETE